MAPTEKPACALTSIAETDSRANASWPCKVVSLATHDRAQGDARLTSRLTLAGRENTFRTW